VYIRSSENAVISKNVFDGLDKPYGSFGVSIDDHSSHNWVYKNTISNLNFGVRILYSNDNTVTYNNIDNSVFAVQIVGENSQNNNIKHNTMQYGSYGLYVAGPYNTISYNDIVYNNQEGIRIEYTHHIRVLYNTIVKNNGIGILMQSGSGSHVIRDNTIDDNGRWGIKLGLESDTIITNNIITNHDIGLRFGQALIYNNFISNKINTDTCEGNTFYIEPELGPNIVGGQFIGGNYWNDYPGLDEDGDGFGDIPYDSNGVYDKYPLMEFRLPRISGITHYSSTALSDITVELVDTFHPNIPLQTVTSDTDGHYIFTDVPSGSYYVIGYGPSDEYQEFVEIIIAVDICDLYVDIPILKKMQEIYPANGEIVPEKRPTLRWEANPEAANYYVFIYNAGTSFLIELDQVSTNQYTIKHELVPGEEYDWRVLGYDNEYRWVGNLYSTFRIATPFSGVPVTSSWKENPITLDASITDPDEWSEAITHVVPLNRAWGWPDKQMIDSDKVMMVRFINDADYLYALYKVYWPATLEDDIEGANIALFMGPYGPPWAESDSAWISIEGNTGDRYGWDESSWQIDENDGGTCDMEGSASYDGTYYWFEFRRPLDSGDDFDWSLSQGELIGEPSDDPSEQDNLLVTLWDADISSTYENQIVLQLSENAPYFKAWTDTSPVINGVLDSGEWGDADTMNFQLQIDYYGSGESETHDTKVYVMNDFDNLYYAVELFEEDFDRYDLLMIDFDNENDGRFKDVGENILKFWCDGSGHMDHYSTVSETGYLVVYPDVILGLGTYDGEGTVSHSNPVENEIGDYFFEISFPLDSLDDDHDFSLIYGDMVGFVITYIEWQLGSGTWPADRYSNHEWTPINAFIQIASSNGDFDTDKIFDEVDPEPTIYSNYFTDEGIDGYTDGEIGSRGDQVLEIMDEPFPYGLQIRSTSSTGPDEAEIIIHHRESPMDTIIYLSEGDEVIATSGSSILKVVAGTVEVDYMIDDYLLAHVTIEDGSTLTFKEETNSFFLSETSSSAVVEIYGLEFEIESGQVLSGSAHGLKQQALHILTKLRETSHNKKVNNRLDNAIKDLVKSLKSDLWFDDDHLFPQLGQEVFEKEIDSVTDLMYVIEDMEADTEVKDTCQNLVYILLEADFRLSIIAFDEAGWYEGIPKVDRERGKCWEDLEKAWEALDEESFDEAVNYYMKAWKHAQNAIKHGE